MKPIIQQHPEGCALALPFTHKSTRIYTSTQQVPLA
jgi:hypothetical protein